MNQPAGRPPHKIRIFYLKNLLIWNALWWTGIFAMVILLIILKTPWYINMVIGYGYGDVFHRIWTLTGRKCWVTIDEN